MGLIKAALLKTINQTCESCISYSTAEQETVTTRIPQLDAATGGIPLGRIVEISGDADSGKTALALHLARQLPGPTLYADADCGLNPYILNGQDLYLLRLDTLEDTLDVCSTAAISGFGSIVIDTVTAIPTREDMRLGINDKYNSLKSTQSKVLSQCLPILIRPLRKTGCTLILVNQLRNRTGQLWGDPAYPTGGRAIGYYAALRIRTYRTGILRSGGNAIGQEMRIAVQKNKCAAPGKRADVRLIYGEGVTACTP